MQTKSRVTDIYFLTAGWDMDIRQSPGIKGLKFAVKVKHTITTYTYTYTYT